MQVIRNLVAITLACTVAAAIPAMQAQTPPTEVVLHYFGRQPGAAPYFFAGLTRDSSGNLYGTTSLGGRGNVGVVFKLDPAGHETVLYNFKGGADGANPFGGVVRDPDGNLYGTTYYSYGSSGKGVVFRLDAQGHETVLHNFTGGNDGGGPFATLIRDAAGNLYGTTLFGGKTNGGVIFKVDAAGKETVLYNFTAPHGADPETGVVRDSAGNLYGTTPDGGPPPCYCGVVYKLDQSGHYSVLHAFTGGADGNGPYAGVVLDSAGNLYGTTAFGGSSNQGVIYKVDPAGQETVLYSFAGSAEGQNPGNITIDPAGNLYGAAGGGAHNDGFVYEFDTSGRLTILYAFAGGADGADPNGVIRDAAGNLYGVTIRGGSAVGDAGLGVVYNIDPAGHQTVLYTFNPAGDGISPQAGLVSDPAGNLYGTTSAGGPADAGTVYKIDRSGHESVLYSFTGEADGAAPYAGLLRDSAGNLYGVTTAGGASNAGVVFKVDPAGRQTILHSFTGAADGGIPYGTLTLDSAGNLYGTASAGGKENAGVVFELDATGRESVLYNFTNGADGGYPFAGVIRDSAGNLYGTTSGGGVVYKLDPAGQETVLYSFTGGDDGGDPRDSLVEDSAGNLYGATSQGGPSNAGVVFKLDQAGHETVLYAFTGGADGGRPLAGVTRDSQGNLYGTTYNGGIENQGVVYKVDAAGRETVLYSFTKGADGTHPSATLVLDAAGNLFGTTVHGGKKSGGTVFKLKGSATAE